MTSEQGITVRTTFNVEGLDAESAVEVDSLFLNVGAIFLEPIDEDRNSYTFANREPFELDFALNDGVASLSGPEMQLPFGGDFAVAVQLEPAGGEGPEKDFVADRLSLSVEGSWTHIMHVGGLDASEPSPLPWREAEETDAKALDDIVLLESVPFAYQSDRAARIYLDDVSLADDGSYELVMTVRLGDWVYDTVIPALEQQVANPDLMTIELIDTEGVQLEAVLDEQGLGVEGLVGDMGVRAEQRQADDL